MAISMTTKCPEESCCQLNTVYIDDDEIPSMSDRYTYICPSCGASVVFFGTVATLNLRIPTNGVIATIVE